MPEQRADMKRLLGNESQLQPEQRVDMKGLLGNESQPLPEPFVHVVDRKSRQETSSMERNVYVYVNVFSVSDIETATEVFQAYFFLRASWVEPGLAPGSELGEDTWEPKLSFMNAASAVEMEQPQLKESKSRRGPDGSAVLEWQAKIRCTFRQHFDLRAFPFDAQVLRIVLTSQQRGVRIYEDCYQGTKSVLRSEYLVLPDFTLTGPFLQPHEELALGKWAVMDIKFHAKRRYEYYIWNVYFPLFLLTVMLFSCFAVAVGEAADRLSLTLTVVLASVAYKYVVSQDLPHISYLTLCDMYVLGNFVFAACVVLQNTWGGWLANQDEERARSFDNICMYGFVATFFSAHIFYTVLALSRFFRERRQLGVA